MHVPGPRGVAGRPRLGLPARRRDVIRGAGDGQPRDRPGCEGPRAAGGTARRIADLDVAHLPGRRAAGLGMDIDIARHSHRALPDRGGPAAGEAGEQITQLIRGALLLLAVQALQQELEHGLPRRLLPGPHPLHLTRPGRLQRRRGPVQALQRDLLPPGVPPAKPLRDPGPEPGPGIRARSLHHRRAPRRRQRRQRLRQHPATPSVRFVTGDRTVPADSRPVLAAPWSEGCTLVISASVPSAPAVGWTRRSRP